MGSRRVVLGLPRGVRRAFGPVGDIRVGRSGLCVQVQTRSALLLPDVPLPLLEMRKAINAQQRDRAIILVGVMRMKVDANIPIKISNGRRRVERLQHHITEKKPTHLSNQNAITSEQKKEDSPAPRARSSPHTCRQQSTPQHQQPHASWQH